jgi:hypothetical protein
MAALHISFAQANTQQAKVIKILMGLLESLAERYN